MPLTLTIVNTRLITSNDENQLKLQMVLQMEGFELKLEGNFGGQIVPVLTIDGRLQAEVKNWSSKVMITTVVQSHTICLKLQLGIFFRTNCFKVENSECIALQWRSCTVNVLLGSCKKSLHCECTNS